MFWLLTLVYLTNILLVLPLTSFARTLASLAAALVIFPHHHLLVGKPSVSRDVSLPSGSVAGKLRILGQAGEGVHNVRLRPKGVDWEVWLTSTQYTWVVSPDYSS